MKLGLVGSRNFYDYKSFKSAVFQVIEEWNDEKRENNEGDIMSIVSGGAPGADTLAEKLARELNVQMIVFKPDWTTYGKAAGIRRNTDIVNASTHMIAFPSRKGKGTQDSIRKAQKNNIPLKILFID